jgi:hypothetical protein
MMVGTKDAKKGDRTTRSQHTRTGTEGYVEEILYAGSRPKFFLQSRQKLERHDTPDATPVDVEHSNPSSCWFQVYSEFGMCLTDCTEV